MDTTLIEEKLTSEIKLNSIQAKTFLLITCYGKMGSSQIAEKLKIPKDLALKTANDLMALRCFY